MTTDMHDTSKYKAVRHVHLSTLESTAEPLLITCIASSINKERVLINIAVREKLTFANIHLLT